MLLSMGSPGTRAMFCGICGSSNSQMQPAFSSATTERIIANGCVRIILISYYFVLKDELRCHGQNSAVVRIAEKKFCSKREPVSERPVVGCMVYGCNLPARCDRSRSIRQP